MSVVCIGQTTYDITLPMQETLIENQKYQIFNTLECLGGPATNAAYLCAMWQIPTVLMSRIGLDTYGNKIMRDLKTIGLNCNYILQSSNIQTPFSIILNNQRNGTRTILNNPGVLEDIKFVFPKQADIVLMDAHELSTSLSAIKQYPNAITILDAGSCRKHTIQLAQKVDYLICSQDFAQQYTNLDFDPSNKQHHIILMEKLKKLNQNKVVITLGEHGLLYEEDNEVKHLDAYVVDAIDTTGAGDIFHGAFAYAIHEHYSFLQALQLSSMASAISVTTIGGNVSIPTLSQVKRALKNII